MVYWMLSKVKIDFVIYNIQQNIMSKIGVQITGQKVKYVNKTNAWWMEKTKHIVKNHYISHNGNELIAKLCNTIGIEVVVRRYYIALRITDQVIIFRLD